MSFSVSVSAKNKADAVEKVAAEVAKVVTAQPVHSADAEAASAAATAYIGLLQDDPKAGLAVSLSGSVYSTDAGVQQASLTVSASLTQRGD